MVLVAAPESHLSLAQASVWHEVLASEPSSFGRLVFLASLRDSKVGCYRHALLTAYFGEDTGNLVLRIAHEQVFFEWLGYPLRQQQADLKRYLTSLVGSPGAILDGWESFGAIPEASAGVSRTARAGSVPVRPSRGACAAAKRFRDGGMLFTNVFADNCC